MIQRFTSLAHYSDLIALIVAMLLMVALMTRAPVETSIPGLVDHAPASPAMARSA